MDFSMCMKYLCILLARLTGEDFKDCLNMPIYIFIYFYIYMYMYVCVVKWMNTQSRHFRQYFSASSLLSAFLGDCPR